MQSRGDYKFGLAAGYVGSFQYQLSWNEQCLQGEGGYCEYIDCRPLKWQEKNQDEKILDKLMLYNHVYIKMTILSFLIKKRTVVAIILKRVAKDLNHL